ncbi:hypothetical protein FOPE_05186 [Fonsecaea pedrosoi]|nr:hypothetical protein FOPE_05186 [Fonsecaea pedrosoi]
MNGGVYRLVFPQDEDPTATDYGWEFDRTHSVFATVNLGGRLMELNESPPYRSILPSFAHLHERSELDSDDESLTDAAERLHIHEESSNAQPPPRRRPEALPEDPYESPEFRHIAYISACVRRDIGELHRLFEDYPDDDFVSQVDEDGDNGVLLAATEENGILTVKWLQDRGAAIDQSNHFGRTPLMEACLWGRLETVQYLTAQGVHIQERDANGMNALDLALATLRNKGERRSRAGRVYREGNDADYQRARS